MDDIIETYFLNLFFSGKMEAMPPKYLIDKRDLIVIRPLAYCKEEEIQEFSELAKHPIIPCNLCGSANQSSKEENKSTNQRMGAYLPK